MISERSPWEKAGDSIAAIVYALRETDEPGLANVLSADLDILLDAIEERDRAIAAALHIANADTRSPGARVESMKRALRNLT